MLLHELPTPVPFKTLFIHDEAASPHLVRSALSEAGCDETWVATSCAVASTLVSRERLTPDLVILDLDLDPRTDAPFVRLLRRLRDVPIVVVADDTLLANAFNARVVDYVTRPIRALELTSRIRGALRLSEERKRRTTRERTLSGKLRKLEIENRELERLVCVDSLTGIANRRHVLTLLDGEWKRGLRDESQLSVILLDLDYFHAYNETYGHPGGDTCLRRISETIAGCLRRPSDFLGRYGGEELLVVLANTDAVGAAIVAERLRKAVETLGIAHAGAPAGIVTISAGFATMQPDPDTSPRDLVEVADEALLHAKSAGRNCIAGDAPADATAKASFNPWWTRFPTVVIDPWLAERIPGFLADARADAHSIHIARRARNFEQIRALARKLKTGGRDHGFDLICDLGTSLDLAVRNDDREAIRKAAVELERYVTYVQVVYRRAPEHALMTSS